VAAALLIAVLPDAPSSRAKGDVDLDVVVLREGRVMPGVEGRVYGPGDLLQFTYRAEGHEQLVLMSIDGEGKVTVFYPSQGEAPLAVVPGERHVLDGSIALDGEREVSFTRDDDVTIELVPDAFRTVNVSGCMQYASRHGLMRMKPDQKPKMGGQ
jgi:hypothetical protein